MKGGLEHIFAKKVLQGSALFPFWSPLGCSSLQSCHWSKGTGCFVATLVGSMVSSRIPLLPSATLLVMLGCAVFLCCSARCYGVCLCTLDPKPLDGLATFISFCVTFRGARVVWPLCIREIGGIALLIFIYSSVPSRMDKDLGLGIIYQPIYNNIIILL